MDALAFMAIVGTCAPLVQPSTAFAIVSTESGFNPHAIGVVAGSLKRQPRSATEALTAATDLRAQRRNFSVELANDGGWKSRRGEKLELGNRCEMKTELWR